MSTTLYNPMSVLGKAAKPLEHPYKGVVVQVDSDINYIGRIKVSIPEIFASVSNVTSPSVVDIVPFLM